MATWQASIRACTVLDVIASARSAFGQRDDISCLFDTGSFPLPNDLFDGARCFIELLQYSGTRSIPVRLLHDISTRGHEVRPDPQSPGRLIKSTSFTPCPAVLQQLDEAPSAIEKVIREGERPGVKDFLSGGRGFEDRAEPRDLEC
jgi:hypothetical protein